MSGGAFRLATLERLRAAKLESCQRDVHGATVALGTGRTRVETLQRALGSAGSAVIRTAGGLTAAGAYRDRLRTELTSAQHEVLQLEAQLTTAQQSWVAARAELKAVTTLHDRHREQARQEQLRREQAQLDELAGTGTEESVIGGSGFGRGLRSLGRRRA